MHQSRQQNDSEARLARELSSVHPGYIVYAAPELACRYPSLLYRRSALSMRTRLLLSLVCVFMSAQLVIALGFYHSYKLARTNEILARQSELETIAIFMNKFEPKSRAIFEESFVNAWRQTGRS